MLDIRWIRQTPELLDTALENRGKPHASLKIIDLDKKYREAQTELQEVLNKRNELAKEIGSAKQKGLDAAPLMVQAQTVKEQIPVLEELERRLSQQLNDELSSLPNIPADDVPVGHNEGDNKIVRTVGTPTSFPYTPKSHYEIGETLGLMDFETAAKMSGSRFVLLKGDLSRLERALATFMLDVHTEHFGYQEVTPPLLVRNGAVYGTGQLPKFKEDLFETTDARWLIPTAEIPLTNIVAQQTLDEKDLPLRFTAYTPCFRSEAGSAGKDTRGMMRNHQFTKVELVSIVQPDKSQEEHERMTGAAEEILKRLNIPYRVMLLCTGDMGPFSQKTYDLEVWLPGENTYREISSCSNCGDYQARRMDTRFKPADGSKAQFIHTLNGSALAVGRTLIAVIENYQQEDGSIKIPEVLIPYMKGQGIIKK